MSPNELEVLRVFENADTAGKGLLSRKLGVSTDYAEYLCKLLFRKGYLEVMPKGQYRLTQKGLSVIFENLSRIRSELERKVILLNQHMEGAALKLAKLRLRERALQA